MKNAVLDCNHKKILERRHEYTSLKLLLVPLRIEGLLRVTDKKYVFFYFIENSKYFTVPQTQLS